MATRAQKKPATRRYNCPVEAAPGVIGCKWKVVILCWLKEGTRRFGELRRQIPGIGERMLTQHLRELERAGILPDGVFVAVAAWGEQAYLVRGERLLAWSPGGYGERRRPKGEEVRVLTPESTVGAIRAGYVPEIHPSAAGVA
jgi:DNA-binding HxlR family transcriptional regulator